MAITIQPMFGPKVADDATVLLPMIPPGLSLDLELAVRRYSQAFLTPGGDGEDAADATFKQAHLIATLPAGSHADLAAKLIIGLHDSHPAILDGKLALDASSFETDTSGRILMSVVDDLLVLAKPASDDGWRELVEEHATAREPTLVRDLPEDELERRRHVEGAVMERLLDFEPASLPTLVEKLRIVLAWSISPSGNALDQILLAGQRLVARQQAGRAIWDKAEAEYRRAWALWDKLTDGYTDEEGEAVGAIALPALCRLIETPVPDAAALVVKLIAAWDDGRILDEEEKAAIMTDAMLLAGQDQGCPSTAPLMKIFAERNALIEHLDHDPMSEDEASEGCDRLNVMDGLIMETPALSFDDVSAKLLLAVQLNTEGQEISVEQAVQFVEEAQRIVGVGRVSPTAVALMGK
jgi:hypothetical protein